MMPSARLRLSRRKGRTHLRSSTRGQPPVSAEDHCRRLLQPGSRRRNCRTFPSGELQMYMRLFFISLLFASFTAIILLPTHTTATQSETVWVWCMSDTSAPTVYFSGPFDSGMSARSTTFDTRSLGRQFAEYLKGRFNTKGDATCGHGATSKDQAGALDTMRQLMAQ